MTDQAKTKVEGAETPAAPKNREALLNELLALTKDLQAEQASSKRDNKAHKDRISDLKASIAQVTDNIKDLDDRGE